MEKITKLKEQFKEIFDKVQDKELVDAFSKISVTIDELEQDTTALENDNRTLLSDYKEMVKHTSFKADKPVERGATEPPRFEDFFTNKK